MITFNCLLILNLLWGYKYKSIIQDTRRRLERTVCNKIPKRDSWLSSVVLCLISYTQPVSIAVKQPEQSFIYFFSRNSRLCCSLFSLARITVKIDRVSNYIHCSLFIELFIYLIINIYKYRRYIFHNSGIDIGS